MRIILCVLALSGLFAQKETVDVYYEKLLDQFLIHDPQMKSSLGIYPPNSELNDVSPKAIVKNLKEKISALDGLHRYSYDALQPDQQVSYEVFSWLDEMMRSGERFLFHEYKVNQMFGILFELIFTFTQYHRLENGKDVDLYVARLKKIPHQLDQTIELMKYQAKLGIVPPAFTVEKLLVTIPRLSPSSIDQNIFYAHLKEKGGDEKQLAQAAYVIQNQVNPAFGRLNDYLMDLKGQNLTNHGVWALPNGEEYYAYALKYHTTTYMTAEEIHDLGLQQVEEIEQEMRKVLAEVGVVDAKKEVGELLAQVAKDPQFYYPNTEEGRAECLQEYQAILERCRKELYPLFNLRPDLPVAIEATPDHEQAGAPFAYYLPPSLDHTRPGTFFVNLSNMSESPTFIMETLAIHEAEPGHHFQIALQSEMKIPTLRKIGDYNAFIEGWALYAEKLAYEQGFYSSAYSKLGHLQYEMMRAARLVLDTGIHSKKWSREEAISYMEKKTGMPTGHVSNEVERYFVFPGQACSYKIGQLKILELRNRVKNELGDRFDIRQFHDLVLETAAAPLTVLEERVNRFIKK